METGDPPINNVHEMNTFCVESEIAPLLSQVATTHKITEVDPAICEAVSLIFILLFCTINAILDIPNVSKSHQDGNGRIQEDVYHHGMKYNSLPLANNFPDAICETAQEPTCTSSGAHPKTQSPRSR